jgi:hypothetical protein
MKRLSAGRGPTALLGGAAVLLAATALAVAAVALATGSDSAAKARAVPSRRSVLAPSTLRSPNGLYSVVATYNGIVLTGQAGTIKLDSTGAGIDADVVTIRGTARIDLTGSLVRLNSTGCRLAARVGDRVPVTVPALGATVVASISSGSTTVCIGG